MSNSPDSKNKTSLSYRDAGVDIDAGDALVEAIKPVAARTRRPGVLAGLGGFGAMFELPMDRYRQPVLVSGTDGVGTKLKLAMEMNRHDTIGVDLVAMCVNDLIVQGAEPLFFLDYYATGKLSVANATAVVQGIGDGCVQAGCALIGGETAEMPGMYHGEDYDLAGFCVGVVEKDKIIDGSKVKPGDVIVGIASSGPHSNGYSLVRKIVEVSGAKLSDAFGESTLGETLLIPTRIYIKSLLDLLTKVDVHAMAHITGGGLLENIPRVLPEGCKAALSSHAWQRPPIFDWLQQQGNVTDEEMHRTFNCGIGMTVIIDPADLDATLERLRHHGETVWHVGTIKDAAAGDKLVVIS